ncbi:MAG: addB [Clostridia bacterium]|jgi:ATP-dependent helicase/nuclease subunit B|nr:addB [Clostridia bacterium]
MNLVLGKSKTGKSKYIYDQIDNDILLGKKVIYFVPSQTRVLAEENYISFQNKPGIIDLNVTTISSYIKDFLNQYNVNHEDKFISKLDRKLILTKIMLENPDLFNMFKKVKNKEGFLENLNIYMDIFKKEDINIDEINSLQLSDKLLEYKLKEITNVYKEYIDYTENKFIDVIDETDIFLNLFERLYEGKDVSSTCVYFDAYNNFTNHEFKFIKLLLKLNFNVTFSITTNVADILENDITCYSPNELSNLLMEDISNIFTQANLTLITLLKYAKKLNLKIDTEIMRSNFSNAKEDIKYLSNNIFMSDISNNKIEANNILVSLTTNIYTEIDKIANIISEKIRQGCRYKDFVIYTSNVDEYSYVVRKTFYEYNIPVYIDSKVNIQSNVLIKYIQKLIEICKTGYKIENIFQILKFGLNDISIEDISYLENYVLEFNNDRYKFEREFLYNNSSNGTIYNLDKLNETRKQVINIFQGISKFTSVKHTTLEIIEKIYDHLLENKILDNYYIVIDKMKNNNDPTIKYNGNLGYQMWDNLCEVFSSVTKIYEDTKITIADFDKLLKYSLKDIKVKGIEPTIDEVQVLDVNTSKSGIKKIMFFVGVNEDKLPKKIDDDLLFDDIELANLENYNIKFKETSLFKLNMQLYNIYELINNVEDKLYFSFVSSSVDGKSLRPSSLIIILKKLLKVEVTGNVISESEFENIYSRKNAFEKLIRLFNKDEGITDEMLSLYKYISQYSDLEDILKYIRENENLTKQTMKDINKNDFVTSVSKLELFKRCPFSYFMKYGLKLNERKIFSITSMDTGSFMHNVLEKFSIYLLENNINWHEILLDKEKYYKILEEQINNELDKTFYKHKENVKYLILKQKLKVTMNKVIITIAQSFNQSKFLPFGYEIEFKNGGLFAPIEIKLSNSSMYIVGKIDRIDTLKLGDAIYARIVDYKSSTKKLKLEDIKEGISLQLITYLSSFINSSKKDNNEEIIPAGMLYFTLSEKLINIKEYTKDESKISKKIIESLRMDGIFLKDIEILKLMDNKIDETDKLIEVFPGSVTSDKKSSKFQTKEEFEKLCLDITDILRDIGNDILSGNVSIKPNKKVNHCKYCEFSSICRKENLC